MQIPEEAKPCIAKARGAILKQLPYDLSAPIVMLLVLPFVSRNADKLPALFSAWDNNISINGDRPEYLDPNYTGDAYYAPGHHPRSFWARYVWLGWRNRASAFLTRYAVQPKEPITLVAGDADASRSKIGFFVLRSGDLWQCKEFSPFGPFVKIKNVGYKLDVARGDPTQPCLPVYIPFSLKGKP